MEQRQVNPATKAQAGEYAKRILRAHYGGDVAGLRYVGGGSFGFVYRARIEKPPCEVIMKGLRADGLCEREANELRLLAGDSAVKVPEVYFTVPKTPELPMDFICMEPVPGTNTFTAFYKLFASKKKKAAFADAVTTLMRHWHDRTNDTFGPVAAPQYASWFDYYRPFAAEILECAKKLTSEGKLQKSVCALMERAWERFDTIFAEPVQTACLIHGDMNVMNIMTDRDLHVLAVIDPLESKWADREYDLFQLRNLTGNAFGLYEAYKKKYPVSKNCDVKTAFYALYHEVYCFILTGRRDDIMLLPIARRLKREMKSFERRLVD